MTFVWRMSVELPKWLLEIVDRISDSENWTVGRWPVVADLARDMVGDGACDSDVFLELLQCVIEYAERLRAMIPKTADEALLPDCTELYCPECGEVLEGTECCNDKLYCGACAKSDGCESVHSSAEALEEYLYWPTEAMSRPEAARQRKETTQGASNVRP